MNFVVRIMRVLDLFSGIGGFSLGLERAGMETVAFCEYDEHARSILRKHWSDIPIHNDVRKLDGKQYRGSIDVVCGGFPCQDLSSAGKQLGFEGDRSSLYGEMLRIISECRPRYAIFENVTGLLTGGQGRWFAKFLYDLAKIGFDAEWHCIPASAIGACHHRDRVWVIAYPNSERLKTCPPGEMERKSRLPLKLVRSIEGWKRRSDITEPRFSRGDDGVSRRMDRKRIARLGNAGVPQIPEMIGRAIMEVENETQS